MIANSFLMKVKTNYLKLWPPKYQYLLETAMKKGIFSIRDIMKHLIFLMIVWMKLLVHTIMFLQHVTGNYFDDERIFRCKNLSKSKKLWRTCLQSQFLLTGKSSYVKGRGDNSIDLSVRHCMGIDFSIIFQSGIIGWSPSLLTVQSLFNHVSLFQALFVSQTSKCPWQNKETGLAKVGVKLKALQNGRTGNLAELKKFGARTCHIYELYMWKCKLQTAGIACVFHFFQSKCKKENRRNSEWEKISTSPSATKGFWRR